MRGWQILTGAAVLVGVASFSFIHFWPDAGKVQAAGGIAGFVATVLLLALTAAYVKTNQETLSLMKTQWDQSRQVALRFGINAPNGYGRVWIANVAFAHVLITKVTVDRHDGEPTSLYKHTIIPAGKVRSFSLPSSIWQNCQPVCDVEVRLEYEQFGVSGTTAPRAYSLMPSASRPTMLVDVKKGIKGLWPVRCPKCNLYPGAFLQTAGLTNFAEALARQNEMETDLRTGCPNHTSRWMLTMDKGSPSGGRVGES